MLVDMGFSPEQAAGALKSTNNDVNQAIAYLFDDPIVVDNPSETVPPDLGTYPDKVSDISPPSAEHFDTVEVRNPGQIPSFDRYSQWYDSDEDEVPATAATKGRIDNILDCERPEPSDTSDELLAVEPSVVVVRRAGYLENYVFPLLSILAQIPGVAEALLGPVDDLANPESVAYVRRVQKIVYYLSHFMETRRLFVWGTDLIDVLPRDFKADLANKIETTEEVVLRYYESFTHHFKEAGCGDNVERILLSSVEAIEDNRLSGLYILELELEQRGLDIYHAMNTLFWLNGVGSYRYKLVAKVVTFHLVPDDETFSVQPFSVMEEFRPHIYAEVTSSTLLEMSAAKEIHQDELRQVTTEVLQLNFFEGKRVGLLLEASINHLQNEAQPLADLEELRLQIATRVATNNQRQEELRLQIEACDCKNPVHVEAKTGPLPVYRLRGLILLDSEYYFTVGSQWYYFREVLGAEYRVSDYVVRPMDFEDVQDDIRGHTAKSTGALTIVYAADAEETSLLEDVLGPKKEFAADESAFAASIKEERERLENERKLEESETDGAAQSGNSDENQQETFHDQDTESLHTENSKTLVDL